MTFIYELDPFPGDIPDVEIRTSYYKTFESYRLTDRHTAMYIPRRFAVHVTSGQ